MKKRQSNIDEKVVSGFGQEWSRFDQSELTNADITEMFEGYFDIFPWESLPSNACGADIGCGSGRWAKLVAPRVGHLHLADPSSAALSVAEDNLSNASNVSFHSCSLDQLPFPESSLDFAYSLGVLHHVPDTAGAIKSISKYLKPGAPLLVYLYYDFEQRPLWFRVLWKLSDFVRRTVCVLPPTIKNLAADLLALFVYWPVARLGWILEKGRTLPDSWPLSYYRDRSFYVMRTDALDRFGTRLEQRFNRKQISTMLEAAGLEHVEFSTLQPFWCAIAYKKSDS